MNSSGSSNTHPARPTDEEFKQIACVLNGLRYGSVTIVVQDGVVVQIDRTEKHRVRGHS